jgi:uncharacterized membrane protein YdjX (TVP38/TMEM64 family)
MMILPFFPDDILSLVAGMTDMSWEFFAFCQFVSRPIGIFVTCYLGSGQLIPFHGWGLVAWLVIIFATIFILVLTTKYKERIENFFIKFKSKKTNL